MTADPKTGERNTLRGMNPPEKDAPASGPVESPQLRTEEVDPSDWRDLSDEEIELVKQGKPLPRRLKPLAGLHQREERVDPTPVELPRHATAYEAPHEAAGLTDHKTIETKTIRVESESDADPRKAPTQRRLKRPPPREVMTRVPEPRSRRWMVVAIVAVVLAVVAVFAFRGSPSASAPTAPADVLTTPREMGAANTTGRLPTAEATTTTAPATTTSSSSRSVMRTVPKVHPTPSTPTSASTTTSKPIPTSPPPTKPGVPDEPVF